MRSFAGTSTPSWQQQASFALKELRSRPESKMVAAAKSPQDLAIAQMHFEQPQGYTRANPMAGHNFNGRLGTISKFSSFAGQAPMPAAPPARSVMPAPPQATQPRGAIGVMSDIMPAPRTIMLATAATA